ncbi:MAG TPA: hypothetical protein VJA26_02330 [Gammaproteobacteria bacterium]|nr:hypothetical protein [Gammaproteobacteria bacterium]
MKIKLVNGNTTAYWISLTIAGIVGIFTGAAVEDMPLANMLAISILTGLVAGGVLFVVLKLVMRNKPD